MKSAVLPTIQLLDEVTIATTRMLRLEYPWPNIPTATDKANAVQYGNT